MECKINGMACVQGLTLNLHLVHGSRLKTPDFGLSSPISIEMYADISKILLLLLQLPTKSSSSSSSGLNMDNVHKKLVCQDQSRE